jgi:hypothetical protein
VATEPYDRTFYIASVQRRVRIRSAPDDAWTYILETKLNAPPDPAYTWLKSQNEFDAVLAELGLIKLGWGRRMVNVLVWPLEWFAQRYDKPLSPGVQPIQRMRRLDAPPR